MEIWNFHGIFGKFFSTCENLISMEFIENYFPLMEFYFHVVENNFTGGILFSTNGILFSTSWILLSMELWKTCFPWYFRKIFSTNGSLFSMEFVENYFPPNGILFSMEFWKLSFGNFIFLKTSLWIFCKLENVFGVFVGKIQANWKV